jgi:hypothetical protein
VLVTRASSFLAALANSVEPQRLAIAQQIKADSSVTRTLSNWNAAGSSAQLAALQRVETIECGVLDISAPAIVVDNGTPPQAGLMALYQPGTNDAGQVTLYASALSTGDPYLALATLVHEVRHAAQYQLVLNYEAGGLGLTADQRTLAAAYDTAWQAMDAWGGEGSLSYGDYAHLAVEYDAFQTGNEVATIVSGGSYNAGGSGFIDTQYKVVGQPQLDLSTLVTKDAESVLVGAVNSAEAQSEAVSAPMGRAGTTFVRHAAPSRTFGPGMRGGRGGW